MAIDSRKKLKEYCLRRLGSDVIQVEISDDQAEDRIDDVIQLFKLFHYDGAEEYTLKKTIRKVDVQNGYIEIPDLSTVLEVFTPNANQASIEVMDDIEWNMMLDYNEFKMLSGGTLTDYYVTKLHLSDMAWMFDSGSFRFSFNDTTSRLYFRSAVAAYVTGNILPDLDSGDWVETDGALTNDDTALPDGKLTGSTITDTSGGTAKMKIGATYESTHYMRGMYTAEANIMAGSYTGKVAIIIKDRAGTEVKRTVVQPQSYWKTFTLEGIYKEGHINDLIVEFETNEIPGAGETFHISRPAAYKNNWYLFQGYKELSNDDFNTIWDVQWVKDYCTQLFKRQWGENLKKYDEVQMVGGVTVNGQQIWDEADGEIKELKEDLELKYTFPPDMMIA